MCCSHDDCHKMLVRLMPPPAPLPLSFPPFFLPHILHHPSTLFRLGLDLNSNPLPLSTSNDDVPQISQSADTSGDKAWLGRRRVRVVLQNPLPGRRQNVRQVVRSAAKRHNCPIASDRTMNAHGKIRPRLQLVVYEKYSSRSTLSEHDQSKSGSRMNKVGRVCTGWTRRHVDGPKPPPAPKPDPKPEQPKPVPSV